MESWSFKEEFGVSQSIQCINPHGHGASSCSSLATSANSAPDQTSLFWGAQWEYPSHFLRVCPVPKEAQGAEAHPKVDNGNLVPLPVTGGSLGTPQVSSRGSQPQGSPGADPLQGCAEWGGGFPLQPVLPFIRACPGTKARWRKESGLGEIPSTGQGPELTHQPHSSSPPAPLLLSHSPGITPGGV